MAATAISYCRICRNKNLIPIFDLGSHALSSRFPAPGEPDPIEAPLVLIKCDDTKDQSKCGLLQLSHNVSADELYLQHYGYRSGLNATMTQHLSSLVGEIEYKVDLKDNDIVVDIGSNDCTLLKAYTLGNNLIRVGIDPTGEQFRQYYPMNVHLLPTFFDKNVFHQHFNHDESRKAKVVTTISMFYDLPDPIAFARDIKSILADDGIWVTEQSYCVTMLERNSFDTICHEHLEYYTLKQLKYIADCVGFKIVDVTLNECNGGSFRITFAHSDSKIDCFNNESTALFKKEEELALHTLKPLNEFIGRCESMKQHFMDFIQSEKKAGKSIYLYGASTKGNTLLQYYGLDASIVTAAAERNTEKYGRRTPRTNIPIIPEKEMREENPNYLLVLPWHFKKEFLQREQTYLEQGGAIIFPMPTLEIYKHSDIGMPTLEIYKHSNVEPNTTAHVVVEEAHHLHDNNSDLYADEPGKKKC